MDIIYQVRCMSDALKSDAMKYVIELKLES